MEETTSPEFKSAAPSRADGLAVNHGAPDAAKFVMLGVIFVVLLALFALILRLRYLSKHPQQDAADLERLSADSGD